MTALLFKLDGECVFGENSSPESEYSYLSAVSMLFIIDIEVSGQNKTHINKYSPYTHMAS